MTGLRLREKDRHHRAALLRGALLASGGRSVLWRGLELQLLSIGFEEFIGGAGIGIEVMDSIPVAVEIGLFLRALADIGSASDQDLFRACGGELLACSEGFHIFIAVHRR